MKIQIEFKNLSPTPELKTFIERKINSLEKFIRKIHGHKAEEIESFIELRRGMHHQRGCIFNVAAQVVIPGKIFKAETSCNTLQRSVNLIKQELQAEIEKQKEKRMAQAKRGARRIKKDLKISSQARFYRKGRMREEGA